MLLLPNPDKLSDREKNTLSSIIKKLTSSNRDEFQLGRSMFLKVRPSTRNIYFNNATEFSALLRKEAMGLKDWALNQAPEEEPEDVPAQKLEPEPKPKETPAQKLEPEELRHAQETEKSRYDNRQRMMQALGVDENFIDQLKVFTARAKADPDLADLARKLINS